MKKNILAISVLVSSLAFVSVNAFADDSNNSGALEQTKITALVKSEIAANSHLSALKVHVSTIMREGRTVVILSGPVDSNTDKDALVALAKDNSGVDEVDARAVQVKESTDTLSDASITAKVKAVYVKEGLEKLGARVSVETVKGVVHLSGYLSTQAEIDQAVKLAKSVNGVTEVKSSLAVDKQ